MRIFKTVFAIFLLLLGLAGSSALAVQLFEAYTGCYSGDAPYDIASGDFNGDGDIDLVSVNYTGNSIVIYLGTGSGTFVTSVPIAASANQTPLYVDVGDINQDGNQDVIAAGTFGFDIFYGAGDGTFGSAILTSTSIAPRHFYVADFNRDNRQDIAASHSYGDSVSIFLNNGDSTFTLTRINIGYSQTSLVGGKFDSDVYDDLIVAGIDGKIWNLTNDQSGSFVPTLIHVADTSGIMCLGKGDMNGDGLNDLALVQNVPDSVTTLLNNGNGTYTAVNKYYTGDAGPVGIALADFNSDSNIDMAISAFWDMDVKLFLGNGSGGFAFDTSYNIGGRPVSLCPGDFDGDGYIDLAGPVSSTDSIFVLINRSSLLLSIDEPAGDGQLPSEFSLEQNYPNPFNPATKIRFSLPVAADVKIELFNLLGQSIRVLVDEKVSAGTKEVIWDGLNNTGRMASSGIYLYKITANDFIDFKKMILLK